jgi:hypothetical protein
MSLEGLLTYFGLLAAAAAIMGPVQRRALLLFVPKWLLPVTSLAGLLFLIIRDAPLGMRPPLGWPLEMVTLRLSPWLTQTVKTMFAVRCEILDRQDHFIAF